tara:strand:+ start:1179 stop:1739 length:561 start_codon:yes stop_codon:yes gene_type:complete
MVYKLPTNAIEPSNVTQALLAEDVKNALVPIGGIIMWSGTIADLANMTSWQLCDGTNGTPDLRNKFIVGAWEDSGESANDAGGTAYTADTTYPHLEQNAGGGFADAVVVDHSHGITDPGHEHTFDSNDSDSGSGNTLNDNSSLNNTLTMTSSSVFTGITGTDPAGVAGTNRNLPPYYAMAFIKRIS